MTLQGLLQLTRQEDGTQEKRIGIEKCAVTENGMKSSERGGQRVSC